MFHAIEILGYKFKNRGQKSHGELFEFFKKSDILSDIKKDLIEGENTIESLFSYASQFMEIKEYMPNDILYYQGEIPEYFYIILSGSVSFKTCHLRTEMYNFEEYYSFLCSIEEDKFLLKKIIEQNEYLYPVKDFSDIKNIPFLVTKMEIIKLAGVQDIKSLIDLYNKKGLESDYMEFDLVLKNELSLDNFYDNLTASLSEKDKFYKKFISKTRKEVKLYDFIPLAVLDKLKTFGNYRVEDDDYQQQETVTAICPTILVQINKKMYFNSIINDKRQLREKEITYLHHSFFFKGMTKGMFSRFIFNSLEFKEYPLDYVLFRENEQLDTLYIIREGSVELSVSNVSLFDLKDLITRLKSIDPQFNKEEYEDSIDLVNAFDALIPYFKQRRNYVLFKASKSILSEWEFYYNTNSYYTAKVSSEHAKIYSLPLRKLESIHIEDIAILNQYLKDTSFGKLRGLIQRIIAIKKAQIEKFDKEYTNTLKEIDNKLKKEKDISYSYPNDKTLISSYITNKSISNGMLINLKLKPHKKITSYDSVPISINSRRSKRTHKDKSSFKAKNDVSLDTYLNPKFRSNKDDIVYVEIIGTSRIHEPDKNTPNQRTITLPNIYNHSSKKTRNYKNLIQSYESISKKKNNQGMIDLLLPKEAIPPTNKSINYLVVKKFKDYSRQRMIDSLKTKYDTKEKILNRFIINN